MIFTREQKKEAYRKLSPEVQEFVMSNETSDLISEFLKNSGLTEEQENVADTEILCAMLGLQTISEAIESIAKLSNKNISELAQLRKNLEDNIFNNINYGSETNTPTAKEVEEKPVAAQPNPIGQDFQKIIMNQAKAMRPAVPPANLPTGEEPSNSATPFTQGYDGSKEATPDKRVIHNYIGKSDPYREPLV